MLNSSAQKGAIRTTPRSSLAIIFSITLMAVLGVASITPAFPQIAEYFHISSKETAWLITVFTLPGIILTPVLGVLADRFGRKRILVPSLFLFALAGFLCTFATEFNTLLILRFFQGTGAASLGSLNVTLIGDIFSGPDRARVMGLNASVLSAGTASYPFVGGSLAMLGWNIPFLLPLLAFPIGLAVLRWLNNPEPIQNTSLSQYFKSAFAAIRNKKVLLLFLISLITFVMLYGAILSYLPFLMKKRLGSTAFLIGLFMSVMSVSTSVTSFLTGKFIKIFTSGKMILMAFIFYGLSLGLIPLCTNYVMLILPMVLFGIGQGLNIPSVQTLLAASAPLEQRGIFMSLNGMVLRLGQTMGPIFMGIMFALGNLTAVFISGAVISAVTLLLLLKYFKTT